jgi:PAS domain S-box-containing protein
MLGVKQSELSKDLKTWQSRIHPGDFPLVMNSLKAFLAKKNKDDDVYENMHRLQHSKGNYRWFKMTGEAKRDRSGKAARLVATFQDITERKHLEDALQTAELSEKTLRSERYQYETLLHAVPLMVIYKDRNSQILRLNKYAEEWLGKTDAQAKGLTEQDLNLGYTNQYYADDQEVITTGQAKRGIVEKSRNHYFRTNKLPYRDADGKILGIIVIAEDITDVVKAQEMLKNNT